MPRRASRTATFAPWPPGWSRMAAGTSPPGRIGSDGVATTSRMESPRTATRGLTLQRTARRVALARGVPPAQVRVLQAPAQPRRLAIADGRDVDQARVEITHHDAERLEVLEERLNVTVLLGGGLMPLDRELKQDGADLGQQALRLVQRVDPIVTHRSPDGSASIRRRTGLLRTATASIRSA